MENRDFNGLLSALARPDAAKPAPSVITTAPPQAPASLQMYAPPPPPPALMPYGQQYAYPPMYYGYPQPPPAPAYVPASAPGKTSPSESGGSTLMTLAILFLIAAIVGAGAIMWIRITRRAEERSREADLLVVPPSVAEVVADEPAANVVKKEIKSVFKPVAPAPASPPSVDSNADSEDEGVQKWVRSKLTDYLDSDDEEEKPKKVTFKEEPDIFKIDVDTLPLGRRSTKNSDVKLTDDSPEVQKYAQRREAVIDYNELRRQQDAGSEDGN